MITEVMLINIKTIIKRIFPFYRNSRTIDRKWAKFKKVNIEYWNNEDNVGDILSIVVVDWMLSRKSIHSDRKIKTTKHFFAIGSVISGGDFDATIWGSGVHCESNKKLICIQKGYRKYDICAVRGPITRKIMINAGYECPEIYGDPAILMPLIYNKEVKKKYDVSVINHITRSTNSSGLHTISTKTSNYEWFIDEIRASRKIISSSLHGIILAETYGIPAVFYNDNMDNEIMKYYDWYYSTQRQNVIVANTLEEALNMEPMKLPSLEYMRNQIIDVFPYHLWEWNNNC